jgi:hypothetical protein
MSRTALAYRVRQFVDAFMVRASEEEESEVRRLLSGPQWELFQGMRAPAQRHALKVYRALRDKGWQDRELLVAALLHDVGKGRVTLLHRVAIVLLEAFWPALLGWLASSSTGRWRLGFHQHMHHAERGAQLAQEAGSSPQTVALIRAHHKGEAAGSEGLGPRLRALRQADEGC